MKRIRYVFAYDVNNGTEEKPEIIKSFTQKIFECSEDSFGDAYAIAQREAYNGEVTVEDIEDPVTEPTQLDQIEAQVTYTALMTDTLLEEV